MPYPSTPDYDKLLAFVLALIPSIVLKTGPNLSVQLGYLGTNLRTIFLIVQNWIFE